MVDYYRGKVALVTGAASGIGRALSTQLVARGARVWMTDIDEAGLEVSAKALGKAVRPRRLDVTDAADFAKCADELVEEEGKIDFLFNNAGIAVIGHYHEMSLDDFNRLIDINLRGVFNGVQAVYSKMIEQRDGHIVNTSSLSGLIPSPGFTAYSATKHAVVGLSRGLRVEAQKFGVRVSAICPGFIDTEIQANADYRGIDPEKSRKKMPFRFAKPEYCAREALDGVARNDGEIVITTHAKGMVAVQRFAPKLMSIVGAQGMKRQG